MGINIPRLVNYLNSEIELCEWNIYLEVLLENHFDRYSFGREEGLEILAYFRRDLSEQGREYLAAGLS